MTQLVIRCFSQLKFFNDVTDVWLKRDFEVQSDFNSYKLEDLQRILQSCGILLQLWSSLLQSLLLFRSALQTIITMEIIKPFIKILPTIHILYNLVKLDWPSLLLEFWLRWYISTTSRKNYSTRSPFKTLDWRFRGWPMDCHLHLDLYQTTWRTS